MALTLVQRSTRAELRVLQALGCCELAFGAGVPGIAALRVLFAFGGLVVVVAATLEVARRRWTVAMSAALNAGAAPHGRHVRS